jgi:hypothetical protein
VIVKRIMPGPFLGPASPVQSERRDPGIFLGSFGTLRRAVLQWLLDTGKILLTVVSAGRRHGPARIIGGPEGKG